MLYVIPNQSSEDIVFSKKWNDGLIKSYQNLFIQPTKANHSLIQSIRGLIDWIRTYLALAGWNIPYLTLPCLARSSEPLDSVWPNLWRHVFRWNLTLYRSISGVKNRSSHLQKWIRPRNDLEWWLLCKRYNLNLIPPLLENNSDLQRFFP